MSAQLFDHELAEDWPSDADRWVELYRQAQATAGALGHVLSKWWAKNGEPGVYEAVCMNSSCTDYARVAPRSWLRQQLGGEALLQRCRGQKVSIPTDPTWPGI